MGEFSPEKGYYSIVFEGHLTMWVEVTLGCLNISQQQKLFSGIHFIIPEESNSIKVCQTQVQTIFDWTLWNTYFFPFLDITDSLLCRRCGHDIAEGSKLENRASKLALRQRNDTVLGVQQCLIQLFKNPHGISLSADYCIFFNTTFVCTFTSIIIT